MSSSVNPNEARRLVAADEVVVLDLRDDEAWSEAHIPGAHRVGDDLDAKIDSLDGDRKLLIVCDDGGRSGEVAEELSGGDREAVSVEGGMSAWLGDGMPSQPSGDPSLPADE
jgi:rhodanese-related sulfurtransferase